MNTGDNRAAERPQNDTPARREFAESFAELHRRAGSPPLRGVASAARERAHAGKYGGSPVSAQRISDWKAGRNVPANFDTLRPVLLVLSDRARRRDERRADLLDVRSWRRLWGAALSSRRTFGGSAPADDTGIHESRTRESDGAVVAPRPDPGSSDYVAVAGITLECDDPGSLARFYRSLMGGCAWREGDDMAVVHTSTGLTVIVRKRGTETPAPCGGPSIFFAVADTSAVAECARRALEVGAIPAAAPSDSTTRLLLDPAGHLLLITTHLPME